MKLTGKESVIQSQTVS